MKIEKINIGTLSTVAAPFSTAVKANGFLFISGQIGLDNSGKLVNGFDNEVKQILNNVGIILQENQLAFSDIATVTIYIKDMQNFQRLNEVYRTYFDGSFPSRTCIAVVDLPMKANVEMTVTAAITK
jgi:reactive intermediate/imine deaminase